MSAALSQLHIHALRLLAQTTEPLPASTLWQGLKAISPATVGLREFRAIADALMANGAASQQRCPARPGSLTEVDAYSIAEPGRRDLIRYSLALCPHS